MHCVKLVVWSLFYGFIFGLFHRSENDFLTRGLFNVDNQIVSVILNQEITTLNQTKLITLRSPWKPSVERYPWKTYQSMKKKSTSNSSKTWSQGYLRREISFKMGPKNLWNSPRIVISRNIFLKLSICKFRWGSRLAGIFFENFNCRLFAGLFDAFLLFNGRFSTWVLQMSWNAAKTSFDRRKIQSIYSFLNFHFC